MRKKTQTEIIHAIQAFKSFRKKHGLTHQQFVDAVNKKNHKQIMTFRLSTAWAARGMTAHGDRQIAVLKAFPDFPF